MAGTGTTMVTSGGRTSAAGMAGGLLLVVPATVALVVGYVVPSLRTVVDSLTDPDPLRGGAGTPAGFGAYRIATGDAVAAFGTAVSWALVPVLVLLVVAPPLALAAHVGGRAGRVPVRVLLTFPLAALAPFAVAVGWTLSRAGEAPTGPSTLPAAVVVWATTIGLACAVGVTAYLAVLRGARSVAGAVAAAGVSGAVLAVTALALALQDGGYALGLGPVTGRGAPFQLVVNFGFSTLQVGSAAAVSTILLAVLGLLGIAVTVLLVVTGVRLEVLGRTRPGGADEAGEADALRGGHAAPVRRLAAVLATAGALAVLVVTVAALWPWLSRIGADDVPDGVSVAAVLANTWLPPLVTATVSVGVAAAAAFGIGALRPLGRWSEVLLLLFAPWLFVGTLPLVLARFSTLRDLGQLGEPVSALPQAWVAIPGLVVLTLLWRGQELRRRAAAARGEPTSTWRSLLLPALPMVGAVWLLTWVVLAQDVVWPYATGSNPADVNAYSLVLRQVLVFLGGPGAPVGLVMPAGVLVTLVLVIGALQLLYLDRVAVRLGHR
ncbi:MAG: hypothetical protein ACFCUP_08810 [Actinomycetales bacterium]